jgi:glycosyltransferase involved in cell wall biosynthesis
MRIALVHDYFVQDGGAERVVLALHRLFPDAPIFCLLNSPAHLPPGIPTSAITSSSLQTLFPHPRLFPLLTPFMPMAAESLDLSSFDLAIISSSSFAKGVIVPPQTKTLCYLHTPTRFLWEERHVYASGRGWPRLVQPFIDRAFHRLRAWDERAAQRSDILLTNSALSQARIARYYGRSADIIHPPVDLAAIPFAPKEQRDYWLTGGRLVSYKRFAIAIRAANTLGAPLKLFGSGPEERRLRAIAGPTVEFLGSITETQKYVLLGGARGFLHPHVEDFGMTMLESLASGTPVLAYHAGGAREVIRHQENGLFLKTSTPSALVRAMREMEHTSFDPVRVRASVESFALERFHERIQQAIDTLCR